MFNYYNNLPSFILLLNLHFTVISILISHFIINYLRYLYSRLLNDNNYYYLIILYDQRGEVIERSFTVLQLL